MAQITDLPEEVIVLIVRRLDFYSLCSMYNSCKFFRNLLSLRGIVLECYMTMNLVATVNTMKLHFFKAISNCLLVLNMCGVPDLSRTKVLPAFKKLKRLKVLDISYTNLNITDLKSIYSICPTLKDITIDFKFDQAACRDMADNTLQQYQLLFEHFENVHFVGSLNNLLSSMLALHILQKSKLDTLKFSAIEDSSHNTVYIKEYTECPIPHFKHFAAYLLINWRSRRTYENLSAFPLISKMEQNHYEFCIIYTLNIHRNVVAVYTTPLFKKFFSEHFNVNTRCVTDYKADPKGNIALMVWNKETTQFNDNFFHKLYRNVKPYFPFLYEALSDVSCPHEYDWICTNPKPNEVIDIDSNNDRYQFKAKRRKTSMPNVMLDYDNLLKDKNKAQLSLVFFSALIMSASLPPNGHYFSKITFLSLSGAVKYNANFFINLFEWCHNLVTLSAEFPALTAGRYSYDILHAIQASQSMKNVRLVDKGMDFKQFFHLLSKCKTLQNIHLVDQRQWDHCQIADPTSLIESCANLYSVFIEAPFAETAQNKQLQWFNKVKTLSKRPHLRVEIRLSNNAFKYGYDPFVDVFNLNPIKPI